MATSNMAKDILAKEGAAKVPIPNVTPEQAKALQQIKDPKEQEKYLRTIYAQNILDGKIKTPIPPQLIRPMVKVEETYNNVTDKAAEFAEKFDSQKGNAMSSTGTSNLQTKLEE